jgi:hypothetical protein
MFGSVLSKILLSYSPKDSVLAMNFVGGGVTSSTRYFVTIGRSFRKSDRSF